MAALKFRNRSTPLGHEAAAAAATGDARPVSSVIAESAGAPCTRRARAVRRTSLAAVRATASLSSSMASG
jgi:hypothetical protein